MACINVCGPDIRWCGNEAGHTRVAEWSVVPKRAKDSEIIAENSQKEDSAEFRQRKVDARDQDLGSREALKDQCGVNSLPVVEEPQPYKLFLQRSDLPLLKVQCAIVPHARPLRDVLEAGRAAAQRECVLLIGPEGDFSPAEYAAAESAGYTPTGLGPIILRVETAVFLAVAAARYALD